MTILYSIIFLFLLAIIIFMNKFRKSINGNKKNDCKFKFSNVKYYKCKKTNIRYASFKIFIKNPYKHVFLSDFPIMFRFYSKDRFKSKIRIDYVASSQPSENLIDKVIIFEADSKEYIKYINDVIIGSIKIKIISDIEYGNPIIDVELLNNNVCEIDRNSKTQIKFNK